jgi:hypothetical protein
MPPQLATNAATGGSSTGPPVPSPGLTATENNTSRVTAGLLVAVRAAAVPVATAAPESPSAEKTAPPPEPDTVPRADTPAGTVHVTALDAFADHTFTNHDPASATATAGLACDAADDAPTELADPVTSATPADDR